LQQLGIDRELDSDAADLELGASKFPVNPKPGCNYLNYGTCKLPRGQIYMLLRCSSISCHVVLTLFPAPQAIKIEHFVGLIFDLSDKGAFFPFC
jgi:hypothetical protein